MMENDFIEGPTDLDGDKLMHFVRMRKPWVDGRDWDIDIK